MAPFYPPPPSPPPTPPHLYPQLMWLSGRPMLLVAKVWGSIPAGSESRTDAKYHMSSHFASLANIKFVLRAMRNLE